MTATTPSGTLGFSSRGSDQLPPYEDNPQPVFDRMCRGRAPIVPNWQRRAATAGKVVRDSAPTDSYDRSVVDAVTEDIEEIENAVFGARHNPEIERIYQSGDGAYQHILLPSNQANVYLVVVVDVPARAIRGHHRLDLAALYGLTAEDMIGSSE